MKFCLFTICAFLLLCCSSLIAAEPVPTAWLDSLEANIWRLDDDVNFRSVRLRQIMQKLSKTGETTSSDTSYSIMMVDDTGEKKKFRTDEAGTILDEESMPDDKGSKHPAPLDPLKTANRGNYQFELLEPDEQGLPRIRVVSAESSETMFNVVMTVDTTSWILKKYSGTPQELPKMIKEMTLEMEFELLPSGYLRPSQIVTRARARMLFINFRVRVAMEFFDYQFNPVVE